VTGVQTCALPINELTAIVTWSMCHVQIRSNSDLSHQQGVHLGVHRQTARRVVKVNAMRNTSWGTVIPCTYHDVLRNHGSAYMKARTGARFSSRSRILHVTLIPTRTNQVHRRIPQG